MGQSPLITNLPTRAYPHPVLWNEFRIDRIVHHAFSLGHYSGFWNLKTIQKERFLNNLKRKITLLQENYLLYASKAEHARIFSERKKRNLANVSIAQHATMPVTAVFPKSKLMFIISIIIAGFAAIGTPFTLEFLDHRIKTSQEVESFLSLPVICTLPEVKKIETR